MVKKLLFLLIISGLAVVALPAEAHNPIIVKGQDMVINRPEISWAYYDELKGSSRIYVIDSPVDFDLYLNLLVPKSSNPDGRFSASIYYIKNGQRDPVVSLDGYNYQWTEFYEEFAGDYYLKGPEFKQNVQSGKYEIEVFNKNNSGKYVLAIGETEDFGIKGIVNALIVVPQLKIKFLNVSLLSLIKTPTGIAIIIIILAAFLIIFVFYKILIKIFKKNN